MKYTGKETYGKQNEPKAMTTATKTFCAKKAEKNSLRTLYRRKYTLIYKCNGMVRRDWSKTRLKKVLGSNDHHQSSFGFVLEEHLSMKKLYIYPKKVHFYRNMFQNFSKTKARSIFIFDDRFEFHVGHYAPQHPPWSSTKKNLLCTFRARVHQLGTALSKTIWCITNRYKRHQQKNFTHLHDS